MYTKGDKIYADGGKMLTAANMRGYELPSTTENVVEEVILLDDMRIEDGMLVYNQGKIVQRYYPKYDYADWKTAIVKWRYSNDDQIAIMLNKDRSDEDAMLFEKMQQWRDWAGMLARRIVSLMQ